MAEKMKGSRLVAHLLKAHGVTQVFLMDAVLRRALAGYRASAATLGAELNYFRKHARAASLNLEPISSSPEEFAKFLKNDLEKYAAIAKAAGIKPE